jgi:peptide/nickel transport system substrate-binding protein
MAATGPGFAGMTLLVAVLVAAPIAAETPKYESTLTYMIPADGPPSFDGHLEATLFTRQRPTRGP